MFSSPSNTAFSNSFTIWPLPNVPRLPPFCADGQVEYSFAASSKLFAPDSISSFIWFALSSLSTSTCFAVADAFDANSFEWPKKYSFASASVTEMSFKRSAIAIWLNISLFAITIDVLNISVSSFFSSSPYIAKRQISSNLSSHCLRNSGILLYICCSCGIPEINVSISTSVIV